MKWWPVFGLMKRLTEKREYRTELRVESGGDIFKKSLHIYPIDVGNSNDLNFDIRAMQSPQYNIHRFGIFFADVPRHADLLVILGKPTEKMVPVLLETINQIPEPSLIIVVENGDTSGIDISTLHLKNIVARITGYREPNDLISVLLKIMGRTN